MTGDHEPPAPPPGTLHFGDLRRLTPLSRRFGYDRGRPVDRVYIETFLERHVADVRGRVLEIGDDGYTRRFGSSRVTASEVLHVSPGNSKATIVGDLATGDTISSNRFDCVILTQTLQFIYDVRAAVQTVYRVLAPGGVCLLTVPGISQIDKGWNNTCYWAFTCIAVRRLLEEAFPPASVAVEHHGNVLVACAFLQGIAAEELEPAELRYQDQQYQLLIAARAVKPGGGLE